MRVSGSYLSRGIFQWQLTDAKPSGLWDWDALREEVMKYGVETVYLLRRCRQQVLHRFLEITSALSHLPEHIYEKDACG